jgi:GNAT superfamily N-acetyltransferase
MSEIPFPLWEPASRRSLTDRLRTSRGFDVVTGVFLPALKQTAGHWWHRMRCSWTYSVALRELQVLDARTLKDVGLDRGDLHAVAYATARRGAFGRFGSVRLRRLDASDLPRCVQFARLLHPEDIRRRFGRLAALGDGDTFRRLFGLDDGRIETIGAFDVSGRLLGLATVAWVQPGTAEIALIVRSDLQRRGLGATLVAHVIKNARSVGFGLLLAHLDSGNLPIHRLARRFGFELIRNSAISTQAQLVLNR